MGHTLRLSAREAGESHVYIEHEKTISSDVIVIRR
jgi:hypothetical protein